MAGAPFEIIERLGMSKTSAAARELLTSRERFARTKTNAEALLNRRDNGLSPEEFRDLRAAVRGDRAPTLRGDQPEFLDYSSAAEELSALQTRLEHVFATELDDARTSLLKSAREILPRYLVFGGAGTADLVAESIGDQASPLPSRNKRARERERHLLLYLQRVAAKNDTFSEFGPSGWGKTDGKELNIRIDAQAGVAARETFLERWTAHAVAAAMNIDPEIFAELCPRLHPNGRVAGQEFIFTESGEGIKLGADQIELIARSDGTTPVHALGADEAAVRALVESKVLRCEIEVLAMEPYAFAVLCGAVGQWRDGKARAKWLSILQPLAELSQKFGGTAEVRERAQILRDARDRLQELGATRNPGGRFLYAATNPIGEECFRECGFFVSEKLIDEVTVDAAPWIDLWRDSYAFVASRVAAGLRRVLATMAVANGAAPLPAFLRACETAKLPLIGPGLVALSHMAFQEVKTAFREMMKPHSSQAEYELTADDCHFVRQRFDYSKFDEYTYPSADLQISARSTEAIAAGDYQWVLAELHPPIALLHHGGYWSCPDKESLNHAFAQTIDGKPSFHFGFFAADFTSHTTVRIFDALPDFSNFVTPQRGSPKWRTVAPAEAEVYVDDTSGDVCVRKIGSHEHLGSFARAWLIPLGFHPFQFGLEPHMPRLRCGRVIVQRQSWTVALEELGPGNYTGVSRDLVLAIEKLRAQKDWPRYIYIRPTEQALRRSGAEGRDKDTKPVFVDLESYLFLEIFHRWLVKAGELEVTEMLPDPDHLLWPESDGRRTFELRTMIVPRS
jgi:hypothetical protein